MDKMPKTLSVTNAEKIQQLKEQKSKIEKEIKRKKVGDVEKQNMEMIKFDEVNLSDGVTFKEITQTVGKALPQIGAVAADVALSAYLPSLIACLIFSSVGFILSFSKPLTTAV